MRRDLERRLRAVELAGPAELQIWFEQADGTVSDRRGEHVTREEAEAQASVAGVTPTFFSETDARL